MKKKIFGIFITMLLIASGFGSVIIVKSSGSLGEEIDEQQLDYTYNMQIGTPTTIFTVRQGFKPDKEYCSKIEIYAHTNFPTSGTITGSVGIPSIYPPYWQCLGYETKTSLSIGWNTFDFTDFEVTPGNQYYIQIYYYGASHANLGWVNGNPYQNGNLWDNSAGDRPNDDLAFKVWGYDDSDTDPPTPNPSTWSTNPYATSSTSISMTATTASDPSGGIEYYFNETTGHSGGSYSDWQTSPDYTNDGLQPNTQYTYCVRTRDALQNEGDWSTSKSATTDDSPDIYPPTPNPSTWSTNPYATSSTSISMTATTASDPSGGIEYYFDETTGHSGGSYSDWQTSPDYTNDGLQPNTQYTYCVRTRDALQNEGDWSTSKSATTDDAPNNPPSSPTNLMCEGEVNPQAVTNPEPRFSAIYNDPDSGDTATQYLIEVGDDDNWGDGAEMWEPNSQDCSVTEGSRCPDIVYEGSQLQPGSTYYWRMEFYDGEDWGSWSETASFKTSLLDTYLSNPELSKVWTDAFPPNIDFWLDPWPDNEDLWFNSYGYGHKVDNGDKYARSGVFAEYDLINIIPEDFFVDALIGSRLEVPIITEEGAWHRAYVSVEGDYTGWLRVRQAASARIALHLIIVEDTSVEWPFAQPVAISELRRHEICPFMFIWPPEIEEHPAGSLTHDSNSKFVQFQEGKSYRVWVEVTASLLLEGFSFGLANYLGEGLADIKKSYFSVKIDWHNPPAPAPSSEHCPDLLAIPSGSDLIEVGQEIEFSTTTTDPDNNHLYYKWYWDDGSTSNWLGPYDSGESAYATHIYYSPGTYYVRVQAKDDSQYSLESKVSERFQVNVTRPEGSITIESPSYGDQWYGGTEQTIRWDWTGSVGEDIVIALYKEEQGHYEFHHYITDGVIPISTHTYSWYIDPSHETDSYKIVIININNGSCSDEFSIIANDLPYTPSNPDPYDGETDVDVDHDLSWTGGDPDPGDTVTYDVYFEADDSTPDVLVSGDQTDTTFDPGTLDYETTYYWQIVAEDEHGASAEGPIWSFTTEEEPDLDCDGSLSWTDVEPGSIVTGSFTVENIGEPGSLLDWEITEYPDWGTWTFAPTSGDDLTPENGPVSVNVSVIAPDVEDETFSGEIKVINSDDPSDFCIILVSLITPYSQPQPCFLASTQIAMADESYKNIEDIKVGDTVKSYNITTREIVNTTVTKVHKHTPDKMTDHYLVINNNIKVTPNHIVFINDTLMRVKHAKVGDIIVGVNGEDTTIDSIEKVFKKVSTYNFEYMPMSNLYITDDMGAYSQKIKIKNPMKPIGKFRIDKGVKYPYSTFTVDIANDKLFYVFDWGDGTNSGWLGPINSGEIVEASHIWTEEGKYNIKVNAKDSHGELSGWSDPLAVAMVK